MEKLIRVEYPGRVVNPDRAIVTLGGINQLSDVLASEKSKLHLTFRPNNIHSKGTTSEKFPSSGVLLKVKVKRRGNEVKTEKVEVLGVTTHVHRFEHPCDYEVLPIVNHEMIYNTILPTVDDTLETFTDDSIKVPYFHPPTSLTRMEYPVDRRAFKSDKITRNRMGIQGKITISFNLTDPLPTEPNPETELNEKYIHMPNLEVIRKAFEVRPIWTTQGIVAETQIIRNKLKIALPHVAFMFRTGPWRNMWVRFGFDPRKDFECRRLQPMEFRLRSKIVVQIKSRTEKRQWNMMSNMRRPVVSQMVVDDGEGPEEERNDMRSPIFAPENFLNLNLINFFQYCDIHVPQVQEMLDKVPSPEHGGKCTEKFGWLPATFEETTKGILMDHIREYFQMESKQQDDDEEEEEDVEVEEDEEREDSDE